MSDRTLAMREPQQAAEVALRRDEGGDRTQESNRSPVIDAMRAAAALLVLLSHAPFISGGQATLTGTIGGVQKVVGLMAGAGVLLFFSLSGYLIAGPFLRALVRGDPLPDTPGYLLRRAARIFPGYWVALGVYLLVVYPAGGVRAYQFPVHFMLLHSSWPTVGEPGAVYWVGWTLGIEAAFYVFVPLAAWLLRKIHPAPWTPGKLALIVAGAGIASAAWKILATVHFAGDTSRLSLVARIGLHAWLYAFVPGLLVALAALADERARLWRAFRRLMATPAVTLPASAALWALAYALQTGGSSWAQASDEPVYVLGCGLILGTLVVAGAWVRPVVRVLAPIGLVSYGMYLWHWVVLQTVLRHTSIGWRGGVGAMLLDFVLLLALTMPLAVLSWFAFERPFMRAAAAWARRRRAAIPSAAPQPAPSSG